MSRLREHVGLLVILTGFLALGSLYLWVTPLLETPDEPSHFSVVKYIADEVRLPPERPAPEEAGPVPVILPGPPVYYAPPLYYALGALLIADLNTDGFAQAVIPNPNWDRGWAPTPGRSTENKHIYVHTADQRPPYAGWAAAMIRLRIFSLLLGAATVVATYVLAQTLWRQSDVPHERASGQGWVLAATALAAFNPAFLFVTIGVTNDALLIALSAWSFVLMARMVSGGESTSWGSVALLGILSGLAALTKQSGLVLVPVAAVAVIWGVRANSRPWRAALFSLLLYGVLIVAIGGWWYLRNGVIYGDPLGFQAHQTPTGEWAPPLSLLVRQLGQALRGYWGAFGWGLILVEPIIYAVFALFVLVGVLGLLAARAAGATEKRSTEKWRVVAILALGLALNGIGLLLWLWRTSAPYGRLLFPTLGPLAALLVAGWQHWLDRKYRSLFAWAIAAMLGLYAFIVPWYYLKPAYASPLVAPAAVQEALPLDVQFGENLHLLGYRVTPDTAEPGDSVKLVLYWQALTAVDNDLTVFVQLAPRDPVKRVSSLDEFLGTSRYPTSVWRAGEVIQQVHRLQLPDGAPAPALYWFTVGVYAASSSERWPVTVDGTLVPERAVRLGPLRAGSPDSVQPPHSVDYRFGSTIRLAGYDVGVSPSSPTEASPVESVIVRLFWQAVTAPETDWIVFVHLLDQEGHLVAQQDGPPRQGEYPTWAWQPGDRVPDTHTLSLPSNLTPDIYSIQVGLYRPLDGSRMPVFDQREQQLPDDVVTLTAIRLPEESQQDVD